MAFQFRIFDLPTTLQPRAGGSYQGQHRNGCHFFLRLTVALSAFSAVDSNGDPILRRETDRGEGVTEPQKKFVGQCGSLDRAMNYGYFMPVYQMAPTMSLLVWYLSVPIRKTRMR